jgi:hypothetical protein
LGPVSEQELAEAAMATLPANAAILGDRNFGVCWVAYAAEQRGLRVLLRLTDVRAKKLAGTISQPMDQTVVWKGVAGMEASAGASIPTRRRQGG